MIHRKSKDSIASKLAFTLIELLVVIGIIAVLAGMLMAGIMTVRNRAAVTKARMELSLLVQAVADYQSQYSAPPVSKKVWASSAANKNDTYDFTYGATNVPITIKSYGAPTFITNNSEIVAVLRNAGTSAHLKNLAATLNSKGKEFLHATSVNNNLGGGIGPDGIYRDPWGSPYIISIDLDMDGFVSDGVYRALRQKAGVQPLEIQAPVIAWSLGPDGRATDNPPNPASVTGAALLKLGDNADNILSWDK